MKQKYAAHEMKKIPEEFNTIKSHQEEETVVAFAFVGVEWC